MGHYDGTNLGSELVVELIALCYWFARPASPLKDGMPRPHWERARLAVVRQWACIAARLAAWRRPVVAATLWELSSIAPRDTAHYAQAAQFVC